MSAREVGCNYAITRRITANSNWHNPPVLLKNGEKAEFIKQRSGFVLAGLDGYKYKQEELQLSPGDEMFFY
ncbi:MAG: serine/threonine-protein phosphatase, partial [Clostridia bacterium]|nr:serine/threonine-protein phosphatase [Clostridia bacterium]